MTPPSFDVAKEPCIPVLWAGTLEWVSLRDALVRAHEFEEVQSALPTVEFGLYRLLIALMGDIFFVEPRQKLSLTRLGNLLERGQFDAARVDEYFAVYADCFDLFGSEHPFLQTRNLTDKAKPLAGLVHPAPSGTNVSVFHHFSEDAFAVSPAVAFGLLTTLAPLMTAGGAGLSPSINGAPPLYVLVRGKTLFETLSLNLCALDMPLASSETDAPSWRWTRAVGGERLSTGYLESLTWMPRKIRLLPGEGGVCQVTGHSSAVLVRSMCFMAGDSTRFSWRDPNCAYRFKDDGALVVRTREGKALWRDTAPLTLLEEAGRVAQRPRVVDQFAALLDAGYLPECQALELDLYGMRTDLKMKIFEWQRERLNLPSALIVSHSQEAKFGEEVQSWQDNAEKIARGVAQAIKRVYPREGKGNDKAFKSRVSYSERRYWEDLRLHFETLLFQLAVLEVNTPSTRQPLRDHWRRAIEKAARNAFKLAADGLDGTAHALERITRARRTLESNFLRVFEPKTPEQLKQTKKKKEAKV